MRKSQNCKCIIESCNTAFKKLTYFTSHFPQSKVYTLLVLLPVRTRQGVTRNASIFQHRTHLAFGIIAQAMWRRKIRSHCRSGPTLNYRGVGPSTGSSRAHTNMTSPWGWISPELPISVEGNLSIHASFVLQ